MILLEKGRDAFQRLRKAKGGGRLVHREKREEAQKGASGGQEGRVSHPSPGQCMNSGTQPPLCGLLLGFSETCLENNKKLKRLWNLA